MPNCLDGTERTIAGRLAIHLDRELGAELRADGYLVDIEYERADRDVKRFAGPAKIQRKVVPDILVHHRGYNSQGGENLLVVEVKWRRPVSSADRGHDEAKPALLTKMVPEIYSAREQKLRIDERAGDDPYALPAGISGYTLGAWVHFARDGTTVTWFGTRPPMAQPGETVWELSPADAATGSTDHRPRSQPNGPVGSSR